MSNSIKVSVLMSVYNTDKEYLRQAIDSVLNQTFRDFEFIIIDDASNQETKEVLNEYDDKRIVLIVNKENEGLTKNLNKGIELAKGKFIARMDADDVSYPTRFEKCVSFLEAHPDVNILGTYADLGNNRVEKSFGNIPQELRKALFLVTNAGPVHPSVMIRKSFFIDNGIRYDEDFKKAQDYDLWVRCIELTNIVILQEELIYYRIHDAQISKEGYGSQQEYADSVKIRLFKDICGDLSKETYSRFISSRMTGDIAYKDYKKLVKVVLYSNAEKKKYDGKSLLLSMDWYLFKYIKNNYHGFSFFCCLFELILFHRGISFFFCLAKWI